MKWICFLLVTSPLLATKEVNFINIAVDREEGALSIKAEPQPLFSYRLLRDDNYTLDQNQYDLVLDGSFRQTAFLMRTLERNRGTLYAGSSGSPYYVLRFSFDLALRKNTGDIIERKKYSVRVGLDPEEDTGIIFCEEDNITHKFSISKLSDSNEYRKFLKNMVFPFEKVKMALPSDSQYLVDLYYSWPRQYQKDDKLLDLFPSLILWDKGGIKKLDVHLGTTYCYKKGDEWIQVQSEFFKSIKDSVDTYTEVLKAVDELDPEEYIPMLEEYVKLSPGDKKALKLLMDKYLTEGMHTEAYDLIVRFEPFFATIREGITNKQDLARKAEKKRNQLRGKMNNFTKASNVVLKIVSPVEDDLVTGTTDLIFTLEGDESPILLIECYMDSEKIGEISGPPYKVPFSVDGSYGLKRLSVTAYFENETFQKDEVLIETIKVDEQQRVGLVSVRATVFNSVGDGGKPLTKEDFEVKENKVEKKIEHFQKSEAPLRLGILLDTSISMVGEKLHQTQYAIQTFLSKLEEDDKASVYTFDSNVLKLSDFTNDFNKIAPGLMTLSPQGSTSLYDAMLIGHDALLGQNGTKVLIVISDGEDSNSSTTDIHVARLLRNSPVIVYSLVLPDEFLGNSSHGDGSRFLVEMSRLSGSVHTKVSNVKKLSEIFDRIYQDLKNLYYFDYYSDETNPEQRDIRIKVKKMGAKVRYRALN